MSRLFIDLVPEQLPRVSDRGRAAEGLRALKERCLEADDAGLGDWACAITSDPAACALLEPLFSNSPFLTNCVLAEPPFFRDLLVGGPDTALVRVIDHLKDDVSRETEQGRLMRELRIARRRVALLVALADITGFWPLERVTQALSDFADTATSAALSHLLLLAAEKGELALGDEDFPEDQCGYVALAMGKHGARELNYSSDIDLIILYDPMTVDYRGNKSLQEAFARLTKKLVALLQDRTADGYVCRVDLRLRPDPGSTPAAIPCPAAQAYYARRGENWERAAMIKARPAAGDIALGRAFLAELTPFVWREQLDFWAAREIEAIKQRINAQRGGGKIAFLGHNIKVGRGGIREIEFLTQTQQLIFGGRDPYLRCPRTVEALTTLAESGHIDSRAADELTEAYEFLRQLEHRLQMVDDRQTQTLPRDEAGMACLAGFMAFDRVDGFRDVLLYHLRRVEAHYSAFFEETTRQGATVSLNLAGEDSDSQSAALLQHLGFHDPPGALRRLRSWREAGFRATRDDRSRKLLAELISPILDSLAKSPDPDATLAAFEEFLAGLSKGVLSLSLLAANPKLLDLLVEILAAAPALADNLARRPELLQAALSDSFFNLLPERRLLAADSAEVLRKSTDQQDFLEQAVIWANDQKFQIAANVLRFTLDSTDAGYALSDIAEVMLQNLLKRLCDEMTPSADSTDAGLVVVALGALGARELTLGSPLGLLFIYEDGPGASAIYTRLARRLTNLLGAQTGMGQLYEVDLTSSLWRAPGPLITPLGAFQKHCLETPDVRQLLALCRARVVAGAPSLVQRVEAALECALTQGLEVQTVAAAACSLRREAREAAGAAGPWEVRQRPGGLDDLDLLVRVLQLGRARGHPELLDCSIGRALAKLGAAGAIDELLVRALIEDHHLLRQIENLLAVAVDRPITDDTASQGLKLALARAAGAADFEALGGKLEQACTRVEGAFSQWVAEPAGGDTAEPF